MSLHVQAVVRLHSFLNNTVYFGTLICPFRTKSLLHLHGFLLTYTVVFPKSQKTCLSTGFLKGQACKRQLKFENNLIQYLPSFWWFVQIHMHWSSIQSNSIVFLHSFNGITFKCKDDFSGSQTTTRFVSVDFDSY